MGSVDAEWADVSSRRRPPEDSIGNFADISGMHAVTVGPDDLKLPGTMQIVLDFAFLYIGGRFVGGVLLLVIVIAR